VLNYYDKFKYSREAQDAEVSSAGFENFKIDQPIAQNNPVHFDIKRE